jgi:hypothetical protein
MLTQDAESEEKSAFKVLLCVEIKEVKNKKGESS